MIPKGDTTCYDEKGIIIGYVANIPISFLIDSGAEVNTVNGEIFNKLVSNADCRRLLFQIKQGSDKPLKAYASPGNIVVAATFEAELIISDDRPSFIEKFYVVDNARPLLSRSTAIRY